MMTLSWSVPLDGDGPRCPSHRARVDFNSNVVVVNPHLHRKRFRGLCQRIRVKLQLDLGQTQRRLITHDNLVDMFSHPTVNGCCIPFVGAHALPFVGRPATRVDLRVRFR